MKDQLVRELMKSADEEREAMEEKAQVSMDESKSKYSKFISKARNVGSEKERRQETYTSLIESEINAFRSGDE